MKKAVAALIVFAMIALTVPAAFANGADDGVMPAAEPVSISVQSGTESIDETGVVEILFTPDADGILSVTLSANPGYKIWVYRVGDGGSVGLAKNGSEQKTYEYELAGGVAYRIHITGYYNWGESAATITYAASFTAKTIEIPPVAIDKSNAELQLGVNKVDLLENTIVSLYDFIPAEPGIYTITVDNGVTLATYGFAMWNRLAGAENGVLIHTATAANQTVLLGLTANTASVTVTIEKTGDYTPVAQNEYISYAPTCPIVSDFTDPTDLVSVDINKEQKVVLGDDGYYHLGAANGPVVYVNLNNNQLTLSLLYNAGAPTTMRGIYIGEDGEKHYYDFMEMIGGDYYSYSQENDYHPLNRDLMIFLKAYGKSQGWYKANTSSFENVRSGEFLEESAWLASCYSTVSYFEPENSEAPDDTGDAGIMGAVLIMTVSGLCAAAVVCRKKIF